MSEKLYAERDAEELDKAGGFYYKHVFAMTSEGLHSKSDIAAELGYRDMRIDALEARQTANQIKADAVNEFVCMMIGALESGFVDKNNPTLAEIHRAAHHHVKDNYGIELPNIEDQWGDETAELCGLKLQTQKEADQ